MLAPPLLKVAFRPMPGRITPRQLGPIRRMPWRFAFSSTARSSACPSAPVSPKPAVMITADLTPCLPQSSMMSGTDCGGVAMTANSTDSSIRAREA